jgi:hypothetical protein
LGWDINQQKNREMGGPFALDGRRLMEGQNNKQKSASTMGGVLKRRDDRGGTCGGVLSLCLEWRIDEEKKQQRKYVVALDGCQRIKITQQPTKSTLARRRR